MIVPVRVYAMACVRRTRTQLWERTDIDTGKAEGPAPEAPVGKPDRGGIKMAVLWEESFAKRFHPTRASLTTEGAHNGHIRMDTSCTRVGREGCCSLAEHRRPPGEWKLCSLSPQE